MLSSSAGEGPGTVMSRGLIERRVFRRSTASGTAVSLVGALRASWIANKYDRLACEPGASVLWLGSRALYIRRCGFVDQRDDGFTGRHHLLPLAAEPSDRNRMRLGFLLADHEERGDFRERMLADLVVDLFVP